MRVLLFALMGVATARNALQLSLEKPEFNSAPKEAYARKPHAAKDYDGEATIEPVTYTPIAKAEADAAESVNGMHQRAADNRVIIHHDDNAYNATGAYAGGSKTDGNNCCRVCPRDPTCTTGPNCFHKCSTVCGNQCNIPKGTNECTIGTDCGFQKTGAAPHDDLVDVNNNIGGDQDMVKGYLTMNAQAKAGIKDRAVPKAKDARAPLPAKSPDVQDEAAEATTEEEEEEEAAEVEEEEVEEVETAADKAIDAALEAADDEADEKTEDAEGEKDADATEEDADEAADDEAEDEKSVDEMMDDEKAVDAAAQDEKAADAEAADAEAADAEAAIAAAADAKSVKDEQTNMIKSAGQAGMSEAQEQENTKENFNLRR